MTSFMDTRIRNYVPEERRVNLPNEIGIEVEMEGENLPTMSSRTLWSAKGDGSLRHGIEYVTTKVLERGEVRKALTTLDRALRGPEVVLRPSVRTSTHVHVNVQDMTVRQVYTFLATYHCLETLVTSFCADYRVGNLFSLRIRDSYGIIGQLSKAAVEKNGVHIGLGRGVNPDTFRSMACNIACLPRFGTVEFRALDSTAAFVPRVSKWVNIFTNIKDASLTFKDPQEVLEAFSFKGPEAFAYDILDINRSEDETEQTNFDTLIQCARDKGIINIAEEMYEDARLVQDYTLFVDWR